MIFVQGCAPFAVGMVKGGLAIGGAIAAGNEVVECTTDDPDCITKPPAVEGAPEKTTVGDGPTHLEAVQESAVGKKAYDPSCYKHDGPASWNLLFHPIDTARCAGSLIKREFE